MAQPKEASCSRSQITPSKKKTLLTILLNRFLVLRLAWTQPSRPISRSRRKPIKQTFWRQYRQEMQLWSPTTRWHSLATQTLKTLRTTIGSWDRTSPAIPTRRPRWMNCKTMCLSGKDSGSFCSSRKCYPVSLPATRPTWSSSTQVLSLSWPPFSEAYLCRGLGRFSSLTRLSPRTYSRYARVYTSIESRES